MRTKSIKSAIDFYRMVKNLKVGQSILLAGLESSILLERKEFKTEKSSFIIIGEDETTEEKSNDN